ncbi:MAG: F0F1 ATP synthase subunit B [Defluviicoccus sp.]|nr:F0F1 ATP synthase subunit B [Defluviicoccus sp.]
MLSTPEFWVAVGFVILVAGVARPVWRGLTQALDARSERIERTLDEAQTLHEEAQHLLAEYQRKQRDAAREAAQMIEQARGEAERLRVEAVENLERTIERRKALAQEKISQAETEAVRAVREAAVDIAIAATARVIGERLGEDRAGALIDDAVKDLPGHLH